MLPPGSQPPAAPRPDVLGRRIAAALLDIVALAVIFTVVGVIGGHGGARQGTVKLGLGASAAFAAIVLAYYFLAEASSGQTLGKKLAGVRVVRVDGRAASPGAVALRTVLRIVDSFPAVYLLGLLVVLGTGPRRARLGDLVAGTAVVKA